MKKLSICIPTYNRKEELSQLTENFLIKALNIYGHDIEVVVSDNSDVSIAKQNEESLDHRIRYSKNQINLGYSGNIRQCIHLAAGQFLWIIADDDKILWDGFVELMTFLMASKNDMPDVIFAPITTRTIHGEKVVINRCTDWRCNKMCCFEDVLEKGELPFLFIAGGVIKNDFENKKLNIFSHVENDYLHVLMYCSRLGNASKVFFMDDSLVEYKTSENVRFSIYSISKSIRFLLQYIETNFHKRIRYSPIYSEHLKWLLYHRAGISKVYNGNSDRWKLIRCLPEYINIKNIFLCSMLILPRVAIKAMFVLFYAWKSVKEDKFHGFSKFHRSIAHYWKSISYTNNASK